MISRGIFCESITTYFKFMKLSVQNRYHRVTNSVGSIITNSSNSSRAFNIASQFFIEIFLPDEIFKSDVHAVLPIIFRV